jgi:hypothetical protein
VTTETNGRVCGKAILVTGADRDDGGAAATAPDGDLDAAARRIASSASPLSHRAVMRVFSGITRQHGSLLE